MILSKNNISQIKASSDLVVPQAHLLQLPEKVLAFGTGVLLRGLPNYYIDKANRANVFNGRIVVVKSTDRGTTDAFADQDGMYTICVRGLENGKQVDQKIINSSVSRVLSATSQWNDILACAADVNFTVVISNVTEAGIKLDLSDKIDAQPPVTYPGKLLAWLFARYKAFNGSLESGVVVLPTELVPNNGSVVKNMVIDLAKANNCDAAFITWIAEANDFCSTLVDRIVPGALPTEEHTQVQSDLGFKDSLMIMAEPYRLWAIETSRERTKEILSFAKVDDSVVLSQNINKYREIKIRLLNAPHTFTTAMALWMGFTTVKQAMNNTEFLAFIRTIMFDEITPVLIGDEISAADAEDFSNKVLDRFANPFIAHEWMSIAMQYTSKMAMRCVPLFQKYYAKFNTAPKAMIQGFAAYLLFMKTQQTTEGKFEGTLHGKQYYVTDDKASVLCKHWAKPTTEEAVLAILSDESLWSINLCSLPDFDKNVIVAVESLLEKTTVN
jgi:tagaturonate reductase